MSFEISCDRTRSSVLRFGAFARDAVRIDQLSQLSELGGRELAGFDEVDGEAAGRAIENAFDELADERAGRGGLSDGGGPLLAAAAILRVDGFSADEPFVEHQAEHGRDSGGRDLALAAECFADFAEDGRTEVPEDAEDFELAVGRMLAGWSGHGEFLSVVLIL